MTTRQQNRTKRDERIRALFKARYLDAPRPRKLSREFVLAQLAEEFCLSIGTVENITYAKGAV
ncbi:hypothetical protein [Hymenobacter sp. CRA2]|uniref:hypothetical protein n=1 Tax=Hymenobacter sp. CRA2 TaxID=1955620 RepID=UPI00098F6F4F|nr:hypothetical protein [Hymenobacter sp. CRA2]OON67822.1 hypothetical protein B0919_16690 [Hymenobacter sp. CRA2]